MMKGRSQRLEKPDQPRCGVGAPTWQQKAKETQQSYRRCGACIRGGRVLSSKVSLQGVLCATNSSRVSLISKWNLARIWIRLSPAGSLELGFFSQKYE